MSAKNKKICHANENENCVRMMSNKILPIFNTDNADFYKDIDR